MNAQQAMNSPGWEQALARRALAAATGQSEQATPGGHAIFAEGFRALGPTRALFDGRFQDSPFTERRIEVHDIRIGPSGATARITFHGRQTGVFAGVAPSGRRFVAYGAVVFRMCDGQITSTTGVLRWAPADEPASA